MPMKIKNVDLDYPRANDHPYGGTQAIIVDLLDVRSARDIHITYDFDRDGWVISAQVDQNMSGPYVEKAFIPAWENEAQANPTEDPENVDTSPNCNCETCPLGGPYTCIRHD